MEGILLFVKAEARLRSVVVLLSLVAAACNPFSDSATVARAGSHELGVERLAEIFAGWPSMPLRLDQVERWAHRWVEYALLTERVAAGDLLLDSAIVVAVAWPDVGQFVLEQYHDSLVAEGVRVNSAVVDSAYAAGDLRVIDHILITTSSAVSPEERERPRRRATALRSRLAAGGSWQEANRENEDSYARQQEGRLGVIRRGDMVETFERAAFALGPGEISEVVETRSGFHVLRRPRLEEVREIFEQAVRDVLVARFDSAYERELDERWKIRLLPDAPEVLRQAASHALAHIDSDRVVGTYEGGEFTVADVIRWLRVLPPSIQLDMVDASDEEIEERVRSLMRRDVMYREALEAGITLPQELFVELRFRLRRNIRRVMENLGLDDVLRNTTSGRERRQAIDSLLDRLLEDVAQGRKVPVFIPTFLSDQLRASMRWNVSWEALDRVVERAEVLRAAADSTTADRLGEAVPDTDGER